MQAKNPLVRKILSLAAYLSIAVVIAYLIAGSQAPTLAVGVRAPVDQNIVRLNGANTTFRRMLTKPMVINFWATWCPPCLKELPVLSKVAQKFKNEVVFVGAALSSDLEEIAALKKQFLLNYELIAINDALADIWHARSLPTTYVLDAKGMIVWATAGVVTEDELGEAIRAVLRK